MKNKFNYCLLGSAKVTKTGTKCFIINSVFLKHFFFSSFKSCIAQYRCRTTAFIRFTQTATPTFICDWNVPNFTSRHLLTSKDETNDEMNSLI